MGAYATIEGSQQRVGFLSDRIGRYENEYSKTPNYHLFESIKFDRKEVQVLNNHIKKLKDE